MADSDLPSFSLGLDFDADTRINLSTPLQPTSHTNPPPVTSSSTWFVDGDDDNFRCPAVDPNEEDFGLQVADSDPELGPDSPRVFKRLRRGPAAQPSESRKGVMETDLSNDAYDDIEDFASDDDLIRDNKHLPTYGSICSSSKVPLCGRWVPTNPSSSQFKEKNASRPSEAPSSSCLETGQNGFVFPKLTASPLRRFQLLDSDTEEPSTNTDVRRKIPGSDSSSTKQRQQPSATQPKVNLSAKKHGNEDLWKDFSPMRSVDISTPALDKVCEEYFQSLRDKNASVKQGSHLYEERNAGYNMNTRSSFKQCWNLADPVPPAHHYFFHDDPRIQTLVRCRLPHFSPLGIAKSRENQQLCEPVINYMTQFSRESSKRGTTQRNTNETGSARGTGRSRKSKAKEAGSSAGWVDPKISATIPKDAGKRRVQANGQDGGQWYTSPEGKKVYVSKGGQELSGQMAYRHYKKDNGGFRKSKKKTNVKRKKG